jgi:hypothetical protein
MAERTVTENQIIAAYKQMNAEYQALATKISELELELNEHKLDSFGRVCMVAFSFLLLQFGTCGD